jgi:hypothetical protein
MRPSEKNQENRLFTKNQLLCTDYCTIIVFCSLFENWNYLNLIFAESKEQNTQERHTEQKKEKSNNKKQEKKIRPYIPYRTVLATPGSPGLKCDILRTRAVLLMKIIETWS